MRNNSAKVMALGGVTAALAVTVMSMGGIIPVATYVCPMLCCVILQMILPLCGRKMAWVWYGVVSLLSLLLSPDKEAAAVFLFLGYYPILKPRLDKMRFGKLWKALLFNSAVLLLYTLLLYIFAMDALVEEFRLMGTWMLVLLLILGNLTFFLLDILLSRIRTKWK